jgi:long-chain acyl-CoA synthetase
LFRVQDLLKSTLSSRPCIIDGLSITYGDLDSKSSSFALMLIEKGVKPGDRVLLFLPNSWHLAAAFFGVLKAGAIATLIDFRSSQRELDFFFKDSAPSFSFIDVSKKDWMAGHEFFQVIDTKSNNLERSNYEKEPFFHNGSPDDVACIIYTGGTTGRSKGAMITHRNFGAVLSGLFVAWELKRNQEIIGQILPMTHSGGLNCGMNISLFVGGTTILMRKFEPAAFCQAVEKYGITVFAGVPSIYTALVSFSDLNRFNLSSLRICFCSGAPLPSEIASKFKEKTGKTVDVGWGLTEASPQLTVAPLGMFRPNYVGVPIPNTQVLTVDENGKRTEELAEGELAAMGPQVMKGYWNNTEETEKVFTKDGFLKTGDMGIVRPDGVYIYGRKKDQINSGGYKIWPHEVESILMENNGVREVAVIGIYDSLFGEAVKAFIVRNRSTLNDDELRSFCRDKLASYKIPKYFEYVEALPKSSVGKILHRELKDMSR